MSDAATPGPARQSASQLSENIGDVLASIRRLIAQDDDAAAGATPRSAPDLSPLHSPAGALPADAASAPAGRSGGFGLRRVRSEAAVAPCRGIMAEARVLNRRGEVAFGASTAGVGAAGSGLPDVSLAATPPNAAEALQPGAGGPAEAPSGPASGTACCARPEAGVVDSTPLRLSSPLPATASVADTTAASHEAAGGRPSTEDLAVAPRLVESAPPPAAQAPAIPPLPTAEETTPPPPRLPEMEMTLACTPVAAPSANTALGGAGPVPHAGRDDAADSILSLMIREVVRSELQEGGMTRDLRAMILREVAQALTTGDRGR